MSPSRAAKLAAMSQAAAEMDAERNQRISERLALDKAEEEAEEKERVKKSQEMEGSIGDGFLRDLIKQNMGIGSAADNVKRNRAFIQRGDEGFMKR